MTIFSRATLQQAFPDNPRMVAEFERLAQFLEEARDHVSGLLSTSDVLTEKVGGLEGVGVQPFSDLLQAISEAPDSDLGVVEKTGVGTIILHQVDSADDNCLVPRYKLMSYVGMGASAARPALSSQRRAIYFDTTLAAAGKPVFWTGVGWVDATGAAV